MNEFKINKCSKNNFIILSNTCILFTELDNDLIFDGNIILCLYRIITICIYYLAPLRRSMTYIRGPDVLHP
jgi:hypothetical protein